MNADRNLLFGILAFQNNFIDRQALLAAFDRWTADKCKSLGEILVEMGQLDLGYRELLDGLVAAHLEQHGGDAEKSLAAVSSVGSVRADLEGIADPDVEASLVHMSAVGSNDAQVTSTVSAGTRSSSGLRFTILRPHAKGGLGQISVALDEELNREVAFKEIQERHADDAISRSRFLLEAEVTGGLEHPGIVPVYGLGKYGNGRPFYAMRFVKGDSLQAAIKRFHEADQTKRDPGQRSLELRKLLGRLIDVCNAIEYAHSRRVLHRDLKPGNIMLGKYGETLVVDWGLAKSLGHRDSSAESDEPTLRPASAGGLGFTQMGSAIGTPQYMSPEQADGRLDQLGPATDVYSLGATLYCVLTGRPPYPDSDVLETAARVCTGDFPPPRRVNPDVPAALQAICLKAMSLKPSDRYASARALADDLEHWLADEPVSVHREPVSRRIARWVRNHKGTAGAAAAAVFVLVVGGFVASTIARRANERTQNMTRAEGLVESLAKAETQQVPGILKQLSDNAELATPMLMDKLAQAKDDSIEKLHLSLALIENDEGQIEYLYEQLLSRHVSYLGVIRDQLAPYQQRFQSDLWELLHSDQAIGGTYAHSRRFRAGLALATYTAASEQWTPADGTFLAEQLVATNPEHQPRLREYLRPLDNRLLGDLERIFADAKVTEGQQLGAANALADFARNDAVRLAQLLSIATPGQYEIIYPLVAEARDAAARESLHQLVREMPTADLPRTERVTLGRRRAGAAITLLRQGERESILDVLRVQEDPESLTQFVRRCRERGIFPAELLECLKLADQLRQPMMVESRRMEDRVFYGLLLALGEFELAELPDAQRDAFVEQLANWYADDSSSAIHGATGWLLRHWKQDEPVKKVDETAVPYVDGREWFTLEFVVGKKQSDSNLTSADLAASDSKEKESDDESSHSKVGEQVFHMTFVVIPAGEYLIGSPPDEVERGVDETLHRVKLTRPIAVSDREITWGSINLFDNQGHHDAWEKRFGHQLSLAEPAFGVNWYEAVGYCRWLSQCAGLSEADQAYADPSSLDSKLYPPDPDPSAGDAPRNWPAKLEKRGFRLPTEGEWEIVCRCGANSAYSFGNDSQLQAHYAWFVDNSQKWSHPVGRLRPSPRGLFDLHGNLWEWCHDWYGGAYVDGAVDPTGPESSPDRVGRGGGWADGADGCRTADRGGSQPTNRTAFLGFRVAAVPFSQKASQAGNGAASGRASVEGAAEEPSRPKPGERGSKEFRCVKHPSGWDSASVLRNNRAWLRICRMERLDPLTGDSASQPT